jgi:hypothetical protein
LVGWSGVASSWQSQTWHPYWLTSILVGQKIGARSGWGQLTRSYHRHSLTKPAF